MGGPDSEGSNIEADSRSCHGPCASHPSTRNARANPARRAVSPFRGVAGEIRFDPLGQNQRTVTAVGFSAPHVGVPLAATGDAGTSYWTASPTAHTMPSPAGNMNVRPSRPPPAAPSNITDSTESTEP